MALGSLIVRLGLDAAEFTDAITKSEYKAKEFVKNVSGTVTRLGGAFTTIGATVGAALTAMNSAADSIAVYKGLSEEIGTTASAIAGLQAAADVSGVAIDTVARASGKLTNLLAATDDASKGAGAALAAINIPIKEFKELDPVSQMERIAEQLATFEDGAGKTAVAMELFGRSGAELIPFFNDLAEAGGRQVTLTEEQIEAADQYTKQFARMKGEIQATARIIIAESIPAFSALLTEVSKLMNEGNTLARSSAIADFAFGAAKALAVLLESLIVVGKGVRALGGSFEAVFADIQLAGTFLANGGVVGLAFESVRKEMAEALEKRNKTVEEANQRYVDLWNFDSTAISRSVDEARKNFEAMREFVGPPVPTPSTKPAINTAGLVTGSTTAKSHQDDAATKLLMAQREQQALLSRQLAGEKELTGAALERFKFENEIAELKGKKLLTAEQKSLLTNADIILKALKHTEELEKQLDLKKQNAELEDVIAQALQRDADRLKDIEVGYQQAQAAAQNYLTSLQEQFRMEREAFGMGDEEKKRIAARAQILDKYTQQRLELENTRRGGTMSDEQYAKELKLINDFQEKALASWDKHYLDIRKLQENGALGAQEALSNYVESARNNFEQTKSLVDNMLQGMEDALVSFVQTGKLDFKSLADSIIADLARIQIRKFLAGLLTGMGGGGGYDTAGLNALIGQQSAKYVTAATGMNYVPYDGMMAKLHEGEAIVPKKYNPAAGAIQPVSRGPVTVNIQMPGLDSRQGISQTEFQRMARTAVSDGMSEADRRGMVR